MGGLTKFLEGAPNQENQEATGSQTTLQPPLKGSVLTGLSPTYLFVKLETTRRQNE